jgi:hypothetical protein
MRSVGLLGVVAVLTACGAAAPTADVDATATVEPAGLRFGAPTPSAVEAMVPLQIRNFSGASILTATLSDAQGVDVALLPTPVGPGAWADLAEVPTGFYTVYLTTTFGPLQASGFVREDFDSSVYIWSGDLTPWATR